MYSNMYFRVAKNHTEIIRNAQPFSQPRIKFLLLMYDEYPRLTANGTNVAKTAYHGMTHEQCNNDE